VTTTLQTHHGEGRPREVHHTEEARLDQTAKRSRRNLFERTRVAVASVVDQHVKAPELLHRQAHRGDAFGLIVHVQRRDAHPGSIPLGETFQLIGIPRSRDDLVPGVESRFADNAAKAAGASRDKPNFGHLNAP
jgi:hypothetical protein